MARNRPKKYDVVPEALFNLVKYVITLEVKKDCSRQQLPTFSTPYFRMKVPQCPGSIDLPQTGSVNSVMLETTQDNKPLWIIVSNRPLPSSKNSHFQNEAKCTTFLKKWVLFAWDFRSKAAHLTSLWWHAEARGNSEMAYFVTYLSPLFLLLKTPF